MEADEREPQILIRARNDGLVQVSLPVRIAGFAAQDKLVRSLSPGAVK